MAPLPWLTFQTNARKIPKDGVVGRMSMFDRPGVAGAVLQTALLY